MNDLDAMIGQAHAEAERIENDARQVEARIVGCGGVPPLRAYGKPVSGTDVGRNLTLKSLLARRDPALAAFLGVGSDLQRREAEAAEARQATITRMQEATEATRLHNQQQRQHLERSNLAGVSPTTGRRW
ncbi:hypothetical protein [Cyanobium sp. WAJ14-Wanaka]|uniref:hypothetical protein n=1 Tax=Cyanobium sp. WAJ14-Wanaka TaxID=2823725 RepID=UPI0020CD57D8|nr:hypothetical protein [Cyanobium sp. WAJ14-Wanaka]MCP9776215.1 hypothetical protein [Cyanobium sp. WAJ14-Wanaka]